MQPTRQPPEEALPQNGQLQVSPLPRKETPPQPATHRFLLFWQQYQVLKQNLLEQQLLQ